MSGVLRRWIRRWARRPVPVWYHPDYRLPLTSLLARTGLDPRRADLATWHLLEAGLLPRRGLRRPGAVPLRQLCRVHTPAWLESLAAPEALARVFGVEAWDVPVDALLHSLRLVVGGTVEAARVALRDGGPALNVQGGLHHAHPAHGAGFCPVNDVAVAVAVARAEGYAGPVGVLDLDVHPPDGTAACLAADPDAWIGSLSGADWGPLPGRVDETLLPPGTGDGPYLEALEALLARMPRCGLVFVLAGADPRAGDPLGTLALTEAGLLARDAAVAARLGATPAVWLPAGGYGPEAWRVLAGTGQVLLTGATAPLAPDLDPLRTRWARIARELREEDLSGEPWLTEADLAELLGPGAAPGEARLLGHYTVPGVELALERYGLLGPVRRLGYDDFRVLLDRTGAGDRMRLLGRDAKAPPAPTPALGAPPQPDEHLLVECVVARSSLPDGVAVLFVHWLTLRHPLAAFRRPALPGQEVPGLGMAREATELLLRMAQRLGLAGVALRPAFFHVAWTGRHDFRFVDPGVHGRFEALGDAVAALPLAEAARRVDAGAVRLDGAPWAWEPGLMVCGVAPGPGWRAAADAARSAARFSLA